MHGLHRREVLALLGSAAGAMVVSPAVAQPGCAESCKAAPDLLHSLRFDSPAADWIEALPLGNGRLGAMMHGTLERERLSLNHDTLWSGQPSDGGGASEGVLETMRERIFAGDYPAADRLARQMQGHFSECYLPMADLVVDMDHGAAARWCKRQLDLRDAVASVDIGREGGRERRELFVSHPAQLLVLRITGVPGKRFFARLRLESPLRSSVTLPASRRLMLSGKAPTVCEPDYRNVAEPVRYSDAAGQGMAFCVLADLQSDGVIGGAGESLTVAGASWIEIRLAAETGFRGPLNLPDVPLAKVQAKAVATLDRSRKKDFTSLRDAHAAAHKALYDRSALHLGDSDAGRGHDHLPTDARRKADAGDPALCALLYNFGRYLLISCSRPGTRAANLQGIWNASLRAPWSSNYTTNINLPMNYWMAETASLADCHLPLIDLAEALASTGRDTARNYYGLPGWCLHHNTDVWAMTNPVGAGEGDPNWANWPMGAPWIARHVWEHYLFSGDLDYLRNRAAPILFGAAEFCAAWLVRDPRNGHLTTAPSISPENLFVTKGGATAAISAGCTMDVAMIRELFGHCITASELLGQDAAFADRLRDLRGQLAPYAVGAKGQLLEWSEDFAEQDPGHRHISHLYPVYPGAEITPHSAPELAAAARRSLDRREAHGGSSTGWSRAWAAAVRARLRDGVACQKTFSDFLTRDAARNLFGTHPGNPVPLFQIDANFGISAAIIECLIQSHQGRIDLFPARPPRWKSGMVSGLRTRMGVTVDLAWTPQGARVVLSAQRTGPVMLALPESLRVAPGQALGKADSGAMVTLALDKGERVQIDLDAA